MDVVSHTIDHLLHDCSSNTGGVFETTDNAFVKSAGGWLTIDILGDVTFVVDIILSFITTYKKKNGEFETSFKKNCHQVRQVVPLARSHCLHSDDFLSEGQAINKMLRVSEFLNFCACCVYSGG